MASAAITAAAKRKAVKPKPKPKFKGKYPGPDKWKGKGDPAKRKPAKKAPAKKPASKPATTPVTNPNLGTGVGTTTDSNGNLKLQSNYDIEQDVLNASLELQEANEQATQMEQESILSETESKRGALNTDIDNRTKAAGRMASRGMRGSAAVASQANVKQAYNENMHAIGTRRQQEQATVTGMRTSAAARKALRDANVATARKDFTDQQSRVNPTVGSTPVNSGVIPTKATPVATRPKPVAKKAAAKKPAPKKKPPFKGKRPGPG